MTDRKKQDAASGRALTHPLTVALLAILCCALWGSAPAAIKTGYRLLGIGASESAKQILFAGMRFCLSGALAVVFGSLFSRKALIPKKTSWGKILILCLVQTVLQYVLYYVGVAHTTGVKTSIISGLSTFIAILIACYLLRQEKMTGNKLIGCALGFAGVVLVNLVGSGGISLDFHLTGEGFILFSTIAYALSSALLHEFGKNENPVVLSGWQFFIGGAVMMGIGYLAGGRIAFSSLPQVAVLLYLAALTAVAYSIWATLLKYNPVSSVTVYSFMIPVCGVIIAAVVLREKSSLGPVTVIALLLVAAGIVIVNRRQRKHARNDV